MSEPLKILDLFSGIGGFSLGLERTGGFQTVAFCEIEKYCQKVLNKHWPEVPCYDDICTLTADRLASDGISIDVICGGFPCQDISTAGRGAGIEGERSGLWREYARLIGELRPRFVIVENVAALLARGLTEFSETWPRSGTMRSGIAYRLPTLVPLTAGTESGSWPTPDTRGFCNEGSMSMVARKVDTYAEFAGMCYRGGSKAKFWPTPTAHLHKEAGYPAEFTRNTPTLTAEVHMRNGKNQETTGALNPMWVEWLMGFPLGHTDLKR